MTEMITAGIIGFVLGALILFLWHKAQASAAIARSEELAKAKEAADSELKELRESSSSLRAELSGEKAAREQAEKGWEEKQTALVSAQEELMKQFDALSRKALDLNSKSFLDLAKAQVDKMITEVDSKEEKRKLELKSLVNPLSESLKKVTTHVDEVEKQRIKAYESITQQVKGLSEAQIELRKEAGNLVNALRRPTVRGRWGEIQLKRVVEMAGMLDHCDFEEQHTVHTDNGRMRPDMLVHLPGDKIIVVDAKAALSAYLEAIEATDEVVRDEQMGKHAEQIRTHVRQLSTKAYQDQFETTPDMVVLFLPGESFFYAALQKDPSLIEYGVENNVIIATPTTLIALLRAVAYGWRQEQIADNAKEIAILGKELYDRLTTFAEHVVKVGKGLNSAVSGYNKAVASLETRVMVSARRFKELGSSTSAEVPEVTQLDVVPRQLEIGDQLELEPKKE